MTPALDLLPIGEATLLLARYSRLLPDNDRDKKSACEVIERLDGLYEKIAAAIRDAVAAQRERDAKLLEEYEEGFIDPRHIAARIREATP